MAKLNGVKTINMVAGEVTKVAYEGAEYERVEGGGQKGDIALTLTSWGDQDTGEYYVVNNEENRTWGYTGNTPSEYIHIAGKEEDASCLRTDVSLFRKVSAAPTLESRVSTLETDVAALKEPATSEADAPKFKAGDKVRSKVGNHTVEVYAFNPTHCTQGVGAGQRFSFANEGFTYIDGNGNEIWVHTPNYELVAEKPLDVGDYVKVITNYHGHMFSNGDIIELVGEGYNPNFKALRVSDGERWFVDSSEVVRATDAEVVAAQKSAKPAPPTFEDGDYAKVVGEVRGINGIDKGTVVKVTDGELDSDGEITFGLLDGSDWGFAEPASLEKISEEDAKWAKIGRGVNEYKEGDVVRFLGAETSHGLNRHVGITTAITSVTCGHFKLEVPEYLGELRYGTYTRPESIELVTPVESRFDVGA